MERCARELGKEAGGEEVGLSTAQKAAGRRRHLDSQGPSGDTSASPAPLNWVGSCQTSVAAPPLTGNLLPHPLLFIRMQFSACFKDIRRAFD